jgi:hypothetical protein
MPIWALRSPSGMSGQSPIDDFGGVGHPISCPCTENVPSNYPKWEGTSGADRRRVKSGRPRLRS